MSHRRSVPRPLVVALIGLRAAGAVDTIPERPETTISARRLPLITTSHVPSGISELGHLVHHLISHTTDTDHSGPAGVTAPELSRSAEVVAALDRIQTWAEQHRLVLPRRRVTSDLDPWTWLSVGIACDPWFCVRTGLHEVEHGIQGVDYLLRRVTAGGSGGQPDVLPDAFTVLDIPSHVPTTDVR